MHPPSPSRPRAGCRPLRSRAAVAWARAARRAAAGCAAASAASRLREVLACAGATSFWVAGPTGPISTTPPTSVGVRCPVGMYSLKPVRRGGMMNSRALARRCHSCVPEKWYLRAVLCPGLTSLAQACALLENVDGITKETPGTPSSGPRQYCNRECNSAELSDTPLWRGHSLSKED